MQYQIDTIIYGYPDGNISVTEKIDKFINSLTISVSENITFHPIDEHYSSVQASSIT